MAARSTASPAWASAAAAHGPRAVERHQVDALGLVLVVLHERDERQQILHALGKQRMVVAGRKGRALRDRSSRGALLAGGLPSALNSP